jgi:enoyl-CoA hydratase/carnithine racemase
VSPPRAYALAKEGLQRGLEWTLDREWSAAVLGQAPLVGTDDFREGVSAARKKRAASFTGQ